MIGSGNERSSRAAGLPGLNCGMPPNPMFLNERQRMANLVTTTRLPVIYGSREHVNAGRLMSYGVNLRENFRHVAGYVDKILNGSNSADLPFGYTARNWS
jgi:ABC-type uncharacterized transport system substrate-binding protein